MQIIKLPRRGGKTTKALEILKENERSILIKHNMMDIHHPILDTFPELLKRITSIYCYQRLTRGSTKFDTLIIDNADLIPTLEILKLIRASPYDLIFTVTGDEDE